MQNFHDMLWYLKRKDMDFVVDFRRGLGHIDRPKALKFVTLWTDVYRT